MVMGGNLSDAGGMLLLVILIFVVLFLIGREFLCWYWKINQMVVLLTEVRDRLSGGSFAQSGTPAMPMSGQTHPSASTNGY